MHVETIEGPPTAYDREDDLFELVACDNIQEAHRLIHLLRQWWMADEHWFADHTIAAQRVGWLNGFSFALHAIEIAEIDKPKRKRKTSGGSGKSNQP